MSNFPVTKQERINELIKERGYLREALKASTYAVQYTIGSRSKTISSPQMIRKQLNAVDRALAKLSGCRQYGGIKINRMLPGDC
jgi:hypothetical protein